MIMIIAIIYIFLTYVMFDQQLKITFRKSPDPLKKNPHSPENSKFASPHRFANTENFLAPPAERGERTLW